MFRNKEDLRKYLEIYLGRYYDIKKTISAEDIKIFKNLNLKPKSNYLVYGNTKQLEKLVVYYLLLYDYTHETLCLDDLVDMMMQGKSTFNPAELLILVYHKNMKDYEGTVNLYNKTLLGVLTNRARKRQYTLILAEKALPVIEAEFIENDYPIIRLSNIKNCSNTVISTTNVDSAGNIIESITVAPQEVVAKMYD